MHQDLSALTASFLYALHEREVCHDAPASVQRFAQAYQQMLHTARQADPATRDRIIRALMAGMSPAQSNWEFGCVANTCGTIVEWGGDPALAIEPILDRISEQFARVPEFVRVMQEHLGVEQPNRVAEQDWPKLGEAHPEHAWVIGEWYALRFTGCAATTMLCRDVASRQRARQRIDLVQRAASARSDNPFAYYLAELLGMIDDERLLVLDVPRRLGFRMHLTAIRNNFHLFTLLQDALLRHPSPPTPLPEGEGRHVPTPLPEGEGRRLRPLVVTVAKGERMLADISPNEWAAENPLHAERVEDAALWSFFTWLALKPDGSFRGCDEDKEKPPAWVWGEMKPTEIPPLDGERIVLLGPLQFPRSWDIAFFAPLHPALRSSVHIESVLSGAEYRSWMAKIASSAT